MSVMEYWQEICKINQRINEKLVRVAALRKAKLVEEWVALEREIDKDIDEMVAIKERYRQKREQKQKEEWE